MKRCIYLLLALFVMIVYSCKKKEKLVEEVTEPTTLTIDSSFALPGDALKIKLNKKPTQQEVTINLGSIQAKAYADGDSGYVFFLPAIAPGKTTVTIPSIKNSNSLSITVRDYTPIADAQVVITEFITKRNSCIDSITKTITGSNYQISQQTLLIINQLKQEWDEQFAKLQANDKGQLAYILKRIMPKPSDFSPNLRKSTNMLTKGLGLSDAAERLMASARKFVTLEIACLVQIPIIAGSLYSLLVAPNPVSALILAGSLISFILLREAVIRQVQIIGSLPGIVEYITDVNTYRVMANEFYNNTEKAIFMNVQYRNIKTTDRNLHADLNNAFEAENELAMEDQEVGKIYAKATQYTSKLKEPYQPYVSSLGKHPLITDIVPAEGDDIIIKSVSDGRINYTTSLAGGNRMIKVTSTSMQEFTFDINLGFKRDLDGTEFTKNLSCVFKPEIDSTEIYKANIVGDWRVVTLDGAGNPSVTQYKTYDASGRVLVTREEFANGNPPNVYNPAWHQENWYVVRSSQGYRYSNQPSGGCPIPLKYPVVAIPCGSVQMYR